MENNLIDFLLTNNIDFKERDNAVTLMCPKCNLWKLDIRKDELNWICYKCVVTDDMKGGHCAKILSEICQLPIHIVKRRISGNDDDAHIERFLREQKPKIPTERELLEVTYPEDYFAISADIAKPGLEYLKSRGISESQAIKLKLRYSVVHQHVVFPVFYKDILVGYQGRSVNPNVPKERSKYNLPGFQKSNYLMFANTVNSDSVILCEGPVSAMKFDSCGIGYLATMGKYVSNQQMELLESMGVKNIYLGLDPDAWTETKKLMRKYIDRFQFYLLELQVNKEDYGACFYEECLLSYEHAREINLFNLDLIEAEYAIKGL